MTHDETPSPPDPDLTFVRDRVRRASRRTRHPEARAELRRALAELTAHYGEPLAECPDCHMLMLARRLAESDCPDHEAPASSG